MLPTRVINQCCLQVPKLSSKAAVQHTACGENASVEHKEEDLTAQDIQVGLRSGSAKFSNLDTVGMIENIANNLHPCDVAVANRGCERRFLTVVVEAGGNKHNSVHLLTSVALFFSASPSVNNHMEDSLSVSSLGLHGMRDGAQGQTDNGYKSYENSTVWLLSTINCLIVVLLFSKGKPFRQPIYTNCKYGERGSDL